MVGLCQQETEMQLGMLLAKTKTKAAIFRGVQPHARIWVAHSAMMVVVCRLQHVTAISRKPYLCEVLAIFGDIWIPSGKIAVLSMIFPARNLHLVRDFPASYVSWHREDTFFLVWQPMRFLSTGRSSSVVETLCRSSRHVRTLFSGKLCFSCLSPTNPTDSWWPNGGPNVWVANVWWLFFGSVWY
jgi:hypothetical protein